MDSILECLILLHDVDTLIEDVTSPGYREQVGLETVEKHLEELKKRRDEVAGRLPPEVLRQYERLRKRYKRGIAPVIGGTCMNCFSELPIAMVTRPEKNHQVEKCPSCGIFIYWG